LPLHARNAPGIRYETTEESLSAEAVSSESENPEQNKPCSAPAPVQEFLPFYGPPNINDVESQGGESGEEASMSGYSSDTSFDSSNQFVPLLDNSNVRSLNPNQVETSSPNTNEDIYDASGEDTSDNSSNNNHEISSENDSTNSDNNSDSSHINKPENSGLKRKRMEEDEDDENKRNKGGGSAGIGSNAGPEAGPSVSSTSVNKSMDYIELNISPNKKSVIDFIIEIESCISIFDPDYFDLFEL
jgi:hypothetical protein